jgi:crotonobetainyl-CoA:carnitine CoA-transferase CaiB-like acyl-CoA transferase
LTARTGPGTAAPLLSDVRVLALGGGIAGAYCTRLLATLGATIVNIEPPRGNAPRRFGPFAGDRPAPAGSAFAAYLDAGKRSVTLDLRGASGRRLLWRLLGQVDALLDDRFLEPAGPWPPPDPGSGVIHHAIVREYPRAADHPTPGRDSSRPHNASPRNLPPAVPEGRVGSPAAWSPEALRAAFPDLVICLLTRFPAAGPFAGYAAGDLTTYALSGLLEITGEPDRPPVMTARNQPSFQSGLHAAVAILAGLLARRTGGGAAALALSGQAVTASLFGESLPAFTIGGTVAHRGGNRHHGTHPSSIYPCRDGFVAIAAARPQQWRHFQGLLDRPALHAPEFATGQSRRAHADALDAVIVDWLADKTARAAMDLLQAHRIPASVVLTPRDVPVDPQFVFREFLADQPLPGGPPLRLPGPPFRFDNHRPPVGPAPALGAHNAPIFGGWLGLSRAERARLRERGVI